jgi:hypothetical protein
VCLELSDFIDRPGKRFGMCLKQLEYKFLESQYMLGSVLTVRQFKWLGIIGRKLVKADITEWKYSKLLEITMIVIIYV